MDGADEGRIKDQPAGNRQLKKTPYNCNGGNYIFRRAMGSSTDALFFFGHPPCDFNALTLFLDFMVTHNDHLISQESLAAKKARYSKPVSQFDKRQQIEAATAIG
jgi:hypothetical protein